MTISNDPFTAQVIAIEANANADDALVDRPTDQQIEELDEACSACETNVGSTERTISAIAGGALVLLGLRQRSIPGLLIAAAGGALIYRGATGNCPAYTALGIDTATKEDDYASFAPSAQPETYFRRGIQLCHSVTIENKLPWELFAFWRDFTNLPKFMNNLERVELREGNRSHWVTKGPAGTTVEWDAEVINEQPGELIAWRSLKGSTVDNAGSVRFLPSGNGTEVKVAIDYIPPAGRIGDAVAKVFGVDPQKQVEQDLAAFKELMERRT